MIKLTSGQSKLYEYIKTGSYTAREIATAIKQPTNTVNTNLLLFIRTKICERIAGRILRYKANEIEYEISHAFRSRDLLSEVPKDDKFLQNMINFQPTEKQLKILAENKGKLRTELSKLTGIPKPYLTYYLEKRTSA